MTQKMIVTTLKVVKKFPNYVSNSQFISYHPKLHLKKVLKCNLHFFDVCIFLNMLVYKIYCWSRYSCPLQNSCKKASNLSNEMINVVRVITLSRE